MHERAPSGRRGLTPAAMPQRHRIVLKLRELILNGELAPHQRIAEIPIAQRLGVSRTPVRHALAVLAREGLVEPADKRGDLVREFTLKDIVDAIALRGVLEGMAARLVAEIGLKPAVARELEACLVDGEEIAGKRRFSGRDDARWADMNGRFHRAIVGACRNRALADALAINDQLPFASAAAVLGGDSDDAELVRRHHDLLLQAQFHHRAIYEALRLGQGARVEALVREHALVARSNVVLFRASIAALSQGERDAAESESERPMEMVDART